MKENRTTVYLKYKGHCAYCGREIKIEEMQIDHLTPKCLGHFYKSNVMKESVNAKGDNVNSFENQMPSCRRCNHYKLAYRLEDFRNLMKSLHERISQNYINKVALDFGIMELKPFDGTFYFEKN